MTTGNPPGKAAPHHGILGKFLKLAGAQWMRDSLHTLFLILLARDSTSTYGGFMLAFGLGQFILFLGEFGLNQPLVTSLSRRYARTAEILAQYTVIKVILFAAGMAGVVGMAWQQGYDAQLVGLVAIISLGVGLEPLSGTFFVACRVRGRQDQEAVIRAVAAVLGYGWAFATLFAGAGPLWMAFFKLVENAANLAGGLLVTLRGENWSRFDLGRKAMLRIWGTTRNGAPFLIMALAAITYNKSNLFFLQHYGGQEAVARYSVTWELVDGVSVLVCSLLLSNVLFPLFSRLWKTGREEFHRLARLSAQWLLALALPIVFVLTVESDRLIGLIYGPDYAEAIWLQKYLAPTVLVAFLHNLAAYLMLSQGRQRLLLVIYLSGLVLNLALCAALIPSSPLSGAALAILVTKAAVAVATTGYCQKTVGLFTPGTLFPILLAAGLGMALYLGLGPLVFRELAEAAAVAPMLVLLARLWRRRGETPLAG
ncbi:membrane protein [hydrocarbon metagenome]|uniref:Membrane protein n=1 Tax=hydrocarbon metagenome TaxID=938273 RepID=A0A0W8G9I0_9ZZZZ